MQESGERTQLTRNKRLSRVLQQKAAAQAAATGTLAWHSGDILPLSAFCQRLWDEFGLFQSRLRPLSVSQARTLWLELGASLGDFDRVGFRDRVLDSMFESYCLCGNWLLNSRGLTAAMMNEDQSLFAKLCARFEDSLQERQLFAPSHIIEQLLKLDLRAPRTASRQIELHGFLSFSASETALIEKLKQGGDRVHIIEPAATGFRHAQRCVLADRDKELLAAGHWARMQLQARPESRLAIVVPELSRDTDRKLRLIHDGLRPAWQFDPSSLSDINASMGRALLAYPWLQSLALGMDALLGPMPFRVVSAFLRDPGLTAGLQSDCALLELRIRELSEQHWLFSDLIRQLKAEELETPLAIRLSAWAELEAQVADHKAPQTPEYWARLFDSFAQSLLPEGSENQSSLEFRLRNGWRDALNDLASLGLVQPLMALSAAWQFVLQTLSGTLYQTEVHHGRLKSWGRWRRLNTTSTPSGLVVWITGVGRHQCAPMPIFRAAFSRD